MSRFKECSVAITPLALWSSHTKEDERENGATLSASSDDGAEEV